MSVKKKKYEKKSGADRTKYHTGKILKPEEFEEEQEYMVSKGEGKKITSKTKSTKKVGKAKKIS